MKEKDLLSQLEAFDSESDCYTPPPLPERY